MSSPRTRLVRTILPIVALLAAPLAAQDGSNDPSFNPADNGLFADGCNGRVDALAVQPDGKLVIGGQFEFYNGTSRRYFARINVDGSFDPSFNTGPGPNSYVRAVALQPDGKLLISGNFTAYDGAARSALARVHSDGSLDTSFDPGAGLNNLVSKFALLPDGRIVIVGPFTSVGGVPCERIARLHPDGSLDTSFAPGGGADNVINDIVRLPDGKLLIAGDFLRYAGVIRLRVARLHADGQFDTTFDPGLGADQVVSSLALQPDGRILLGGSFNNFALTPSRRVARLFPDGALDTSFNSALSATTWISSITLQQDGRILLACRLQSTAALARLFPDGSIDTSLSATAMGGNYLTSVFECSDGKLLVTGDFSSSGAFGKSGVARLNSDGRADLSFNALAGPSSTVNRIIPQPDGKAVVVGSFTAYAGSARKTIARIDAHGGLDPTFDPGAGPAGSVVDAAVQPDGKIVVAGSFTSFDGAPIRNVARLHPGGSVDSSFDPGAGPNALVRAVALQPDGKLLIAGSFTAVDGFATPGVSRLHADGAVDTSFVAPVQGGTVRTLVLQPDGRVLIGGDFSWMGSAHYRGVARLHVDGSLDSSFASSPGVSWYVQALVLQPDGKVLIGGSFTTYNGVACGHILRTNSDGSFDTSFSALPGVELSNNIPLVYSIALQPDGGVLLGGVFTAAGGRPRNCIARLNGNGSLDPDFPGLPGAGSAVASIALDANGRALIGGFFTRYDGAIRHRIARMIAYSPTPVGYCTAGTSSSGCAASMSFSGSPSLASTSGFTLDVSQLEAQRQSLLFYGVGGRRAEPWAAGSTSFLCVKAPIQRVLAANSGGVAGQCDGALSVDWLNYVATHPAAVGAPFAAGIAVNAQAWYRDPPAPRSTNLSDALEFVTTP